MHYIWLILGNLWMLPNTVVSALYLGVLALFGQVRYDTTSKWAVYLSVAEGTRLWRYMKRGGWNGWASGVFVTMRIFKLRGAVHEARHVQQQMIFGVFQPIIYIVDSVLIWIFLRKLHSYYDNWMEVDARRYAGQQIKIPKGQWKDGIADRWAWW